MENAKGAARILPLFIVLTSLAACGFASDPPLPLPVATLDLPAGHAFNHGESDWATVAFLSDTSVAVGLCRQDCTHKECSLFILRWEGGTLRPLAETGRFESGVSIHAASEGQILTTLGLPTTVLYSADLSTVRELPTRLSVVSPSGRTVAAWARGSWKLFRLTDRLDPLREGTGELRSVSDELVVIQDGRVMRVETLEGKLLGSFSVPDEAWGYHAALLGNAKLYLDDCDRVRIVDFDGRTELQMHPRGGCDQGDRSSADGRRMLFDFTDHKTSGLRRVLENIQKITSLGMVGPEDFNREEVRVFDTVTGKSCFDWHRSFPMTYSQVRSAAISPSGEFVAIAARGTLSIYRLPAACGGQ